MKGDARSLQGRRISALSGSISRWQMRVCDGKPTFTFQERGASKEHSRKKVTSVSRELKNLSEQSVSEHISYLTSRLDSMMVKDFSNLSASMILIRESAWDRYDFHRH